LVPAFCLLGRLDVVDSVGVAVMTVVAGEVGVRPVALRLDVPHTTARDWLRRFRARAAMLSAGFSAVAVELSGGALELSGGALELPGGALELPAGVDRAALAAMSWAWSAAVWRVGTAAGSMWVFGSLVTGGALLAANTDPPWLMFGRRRLMPPVP
jgi:hypothetical protein